MADAMIETLHRIDKKEGLAIIALASSIASPHYHEE
jgi:hypothetical protein